MNTKNHVSVKIKSKLASEMCTPTYY